MKANEAEKLLHAYLDGELDSASALELEARMAETPALRAACERLRELSAAVREKAQYHRAPEPLAARIRAALPPVSAEKPRERRRWLLPASAFAAAVGIGFALSAALMRPGDEDLVAREAVASHVRASLASRLTDVASSDQHAVKPWLSARLPFSPPVPELSQHGFELLGARVDYLDGKPAAVLAYKRRQHTIDLFISPGTESRRATLAARDGFNVERFARGGMRFVAVSDLNANELRDFAELAARR